MPIKYTFSLAEGLGTFSRRALGFLESPDDTDLNARSVFDGLQEDEKRLVRSRFDLWISGGIKPSYFHGWPNQPRYKGCFVFKWKRHRVGQRLYGFLCHPTPRSNGAFQLCVLVYYDSKTEHETDLVILDGINMLRRELNAISAIANTYTEYVGDAK